jgi:nucleoside-diphosphate-sugar epimerase
VRILTTGGTGFLGKTLLQLLSEKGAATQNLGRISSYPELLHQISEFRPDVVVHLATHFVNDHQPADVEKIIDCNIRFGSLILEAMKALGIKNIVVAGTASQNFKTNPTIGASLYAASKTAFEELLKFYFDADHFKVVVLKIYETYGLNDTRQKLIPHLIQSKPGQKFVLSPGEQKMNLVSAKDTAQAFWLAAQHACNSQQPIYEEYFLRNEWFTLRELVKVIEQNLGRSLNIEWGGKPYRDREILHPFTGGALLPGWKPEQNFADVVAQSTHRSIG